MVIAMSGFEFFLRKKGIQVEIILRKTGSDFVESNRPCQRVKAFAWRTGTVSSATANSALGRFLALRWDVSWHVFAAS
jgi:hypothetical protein